MLHSHLEGSRPFYRDTIKIYDIDNEHGKMRGKRYTDLVRSEHLLSQVGMKDHQAVECGKTG